MPTVTGDPREKNLPKWARKQLRQTHAEARYLRARLAELGAELALYTRQAMQDAADTDTVIALESGVLPLRPGTPVQFTVDGHHLDAYVEDGHLVVDLTDGAQLVVHPRHPNVIYVEGTR